MPEQKESEEKESEQKESEQKAWGQGWRGC